MSVQLPQIDWNDMALQFLPATHRTPRFIAWMQGMVTGSVGWLNKNFYNYCYGDSVSAFWDISTTYSLNQTVVTYQGVYISVVNGNIGNNPDNSPLSWYQISPSYIGAQERAQYTSQRLTFEYALNRYFRTTFRNPTSISISGGIVTYGYLPKSDIYIETVPVSGTSFISYAGESLSSVSYAGSSLDYYSYAGYVSSSDTTYQYIVYIPTSLATALGYPTTNNYIQIVSQKVNLISLLGTIFTVQTY